MRTIVCKNPVGTAVKRREKDGDVRLVTDESAGPGDFGGCRGCYDFWLRQLDESNVVVEDSTRVLFAETRCPRNEVGLDFLPNELRQNHSADAGRAKGQYGFIQPPGREDPACEDVRIDEEAEPRGSRHPRFALEVLGLRFFAFCRRFASSGYSRA
jgi:hypothetical protein